MWHSCGGAAKVHVTTRRFNELQFFFMDSMTGMKKGCLLYLQKANGNGKGDTGGAERPLALRDGPGVSLQLPQQVRQIHVHPVDGL